MSKTYVIADLHGRYDLLLRAIAAIEADATGGRFIVLGDFIDRGPQSGQIIARLMTGPASPQWRWQVIQGNHEAIMLTALERPLTALPWWIRNGGGATLQSYGYADKDPLYPLRIPQAHIAYLLALPIWLEDEHRIYVHAGVPHDQSVSEAKTDTLQWMLYPGDVHHNAAEVHDDRPHISGKHIVHGHHQSPNHPLLKPHRTNLDSFAWHSGRLAIGVFDDAVPGGPVRVMEVTG